MLFHNIKYLTNDTLGILVGTIEDKRITVEDAYPLTHLRVTLPFLENAINLVILFYFIFYNYNFRLNYN